MNQSDRTKGWTQSYIFNYYTVLIVKFYLWTIFFMLIVYNVNLWFNYCSLLFDAKFFLNMRVLCGKIQKITIHQCLHSEYFIFNKALNYTIIQLGILYIILFRSPFCYSNNVTRIKLQHCVDARIFRFLILCLCQTHHNQLKIKNTDFCFVFFSDLWPIHIPIYPYAFRKSLVKVGMTEIQNAILCKGRI